MQELPFLHSARRLMLIDICIKFREDSLRGFQVTERTRFVRQTDRRCPGKNNMSPNPEGGRHNYDEQESRMLHTKFHGNRSASSGEDFLRVFTIYGHGGHYGHMTQKQRTDFR